MRCRPPPLALLVLLALPLAGCGQKGPLYLPGDEAAAERYGPRDAADDTDPAEGTDAPRPADEEQN